MNAGDWNKRALGFGFGAGADGSDFRFFRAQDRKLARENRFKVMITSVVSADEIPPELGVTNSAGE